MSTGCYRASPLLLSAFLLSASTPSALGQTPPAAREFGPGVRIDWPNLTVELDSEVVLRQGPLELFACSPNTKEHESILRVAARPMHIYQAMGLIGLTPGSPVRYDEKENRWEPPRGEGLDIRVRYTDDAGRTMFIAPENWLTPAKPQATPVALPWVFAGSYTLSDGRFAADIEGTVLCLVDFEAALIAIPALHSADNEQLWLVANTPAIPPKGTKCTLLIRAARRPPVRIELRPDGTIHQGEQTLDPAAVADLVGSRADDPRPSHLRICVAQGTTDETQDAVVKKIKATPGYQGLIETKRAPCRFDGESWATPPARD